MHLSMHAQAATGRWRASTGLSWLCRVASAADRQERACPCDNSNKVSISDRIWRPPVSGIWKPMPAPARKPRPTSVITASVRPGSGRVHERTTLGSRPAPGTSSAKRSVGTRRAASMHAGHAVRRNRTRSAALPAGTFSGHRQRSRRICHQSESATSVVADSLRRRAARRGARAIARRRGH
jgi:hypothetical protein